MTTFADRAIAYYNALEAPSSLPPGVGAMNPYQQPEVQRVVTEFYTKFFLIPTRACSYWASTPADLGRA
jgi:hypothetical protein